MEDNLLTMRERAAWLRSAERSPQLGQFERRLIGQRTREALAAKKASGVRLGRPPTVPRSVVRRIQRLRCRGLSLRAIADELNEGGVATAQDGKQWYAATVRHVLIRTS
jgi:DNA invertase Pin-like site-specific DNA recombinase